MNIMGITQVDFLQEVNELAIWLSNNQRPVSSQLTDYLRSRNKDEHDDDEAYDRLPTDQLQIIDYLVGYQLIQEIEPSLQPIFNSDYSKQIRFIVGTSNLSNRELIAFNERIDAWIADNISKKYKVLHGDNSILFARLNTKITVELLQGFSLSFAFITLTMIIGLQVCDYGLLSIIPNLFPPPSFSVFGVY